jgi:hypothetical protein
VHVVERDEICEVLVRLVPKDGRSSGGAENAWAAKTGGGGHREGKDQHVRTVDTGYAARRGKKSALSRQRRARVSRAPMLLSGAIEIAEESLSEFLA